MVSRSAPSRRGGFGKWEVVLSVRGVGSMGGGSGGGWGGEVEGGLWALSDCRCGDGCLLSSGCIFISVISRY